MADTRLEVVRCSRLSPQTYSAHLLLADHRAAGDRDLEAVARGSQSRSRLSTSSRSTPPPSYSPQTPRGPCPDPPNPTRIALTHCSLKWCQMTRRWASLRLRECRPAGLRARRKNLPTQVRQRPWRAQVRPRPWLAYTGASQPRGGPAPWRASSVEGPSLDTRPATRR